MLLPFAFVFAFTFVLPCTTVAKTPASGGFYMGCQDINVVAGIVVKETARIVGLKSTEYVAVVIRGSISPLTKRGSVCFPHGR